MITFAVVTKAAKGRGNLAFAGQLFLDPQAQGGSFEDEPKPLHEALHAPALLVYVQKPVFQVGEILILNEDGREPCYPGRKPSKWDVTVEEFTDIYAAIARAQKAMDEEPLL